ncbi:hypothetical protein N7523_002159 [Penicillium sp. IBT 18751x]|nr:hypothetical protein N7523_002159 [Penicillium sp. IBT 18751x]
MNSPIRLSYGDNPSPTQVESMGPSERWENPWMRKRERVRSRAPIRRNYSCTLILTYSTWAGIARVLWSQSLQDEQGLVEELTGS